MATTFKNCTLVCPTTDTVLYTCPDGARAVVLGLQVANTHATVFADLRLKLYDSSSATDIVLMNDVTVPVQAAVGLLAGKLVLETGDSLKARASVAGILNIIGSVTEMS